METSTTTKQSKTWVIAAAGLVACIAVLAWALSKPSEEALPDAPTPEEPAPVAAAPTTQEAKPAAVPLAKPAAPAKVEVKPSAKPEVDLFAEPMPEFMVDLHARVLDKQPLNVEQQKALYKYGQENKGDARPQLLLAWDSVNRDWDGMAVRVYGMAFRADPRARDSKNLADLVQLMSKHDTKRVEFTDAQEIIVENYGGSALPIVEEQLAKLNAAGELTRAARVSKLRDDLGKL
ncbi:MAG TPA: hypothetical protein VJR89_24015 [Polyangiales bacterium]|nr:hypothetical protein [Polyangiales bacterium]